MINCSIIIPTYNRPGHLKRILGYYSGYETTYNIIVVDSSSDENKELNKNIISSVSNLDIQYLDNYSSKINPFHKMADALNYVNTEYCLFCADDDFITPNGINQSVDFLEKNPYFTVAQGYFISFWVKSDGEAPQFCWRPTYSHKSITFPDPEPRLTYHLSDYSIPTYYAVHRTDFLKLIFEETVKFTNYDRFGELLPSMLTAVYGKIKCLEVLYAAREYSPSSSGQTSEGLTEFIKNGSYNQKYARFRDCLSLHLSKQAQLDIKESGKVVDKAMSAYMKKSFPYNPLIIKMAGILDYLRLPDWIDKRIRALYRVLFLAKQKPDSSFSVDISPAYEYYEDLNKIRLHVLSCSKIDLR